MLSTLANPCSSISARSTVKPAASRRATGSVIAGCSIGLETTCPGDTSAPAKPKTARLLASVPPEVKITSVGSASRIRATVSLAQFPGAPRRTSERVPALGVARGQEMRPHRLEHFRIQRTPSRCDPDRSAQDAWPIEMDLIRLGR